MTFELHVSVVAGLAGASSALLVIGGARAPLLGWLALAPLAAALPSLPPWAAAIAGAVAGGVPAAASVWSRPLRPLIPMTAAPVALVWAAGAAAFAGSALPDAFLLLALPITALAAIVPPRLLGAPRWVANPLARTQERWLAVVHVARHGGDATVTLALATTAAALGIAIRGSLPGAWPWAGAAALVVGALVALGFRSYRRAAERVDGSARVRVAAVVVDPEESDGDGFGAAPGTSIRDIEATAGRYTPHIERAAAAGARIIVLPELCAFVGPSSRDAWIEAARRWASTLDVAIVTPYFDVRRPENALDVIDRTGPVGHYQKRHPGRGLEPRATEWTPFGPFRVVAGPLTYDLCTAICVDIDYQDVVAPLRAAGGFLAVPSSDWFGGFEELHHRSAVWCAALSGASLVRATQRGISAFYDGAGRVIASRSSRGGPVVLIADVPL